jgi:hypothetical protein
MALGWQKTLAAVLAYEYDRQGQSGDGQPPRTAAPDGEERTRALAALVAGQAARPCLAEATAGLFGKPPVALVSFDADRIKDYILATAKLAEMRGASAAVRRELGSNSVAEWLRAELGQREAASCVVLFAGGGSGLLITPASLAEKVEKLIEGKFAEMTHGGTCTAVSAAFWPEELVWGKPMPPGAGGQGLALSGALWSEGDKPLPFGALVGHLGVRLRRKKMGKFAGASFTALPGIIHRCESCGLNPAEMAGEAKDQPVAGNAGETDGPPSPEKPPRRERPGTEGLCRSCLSKRDYGDKHSHLEALSIDEVVGKPPENESSSSEDRGRPGYVAVAHFDANGLGVRLENLPTAEAVVEFSLAVGEIFQACRGHVVGTLELAGVQAGPQHEKKPGRYQAPLFGGDDLLLILPADKAVKAVESAMDFLNTRFSAGKPTVAPAVRDALTKVSVSCGLVLAPPHFPMSLLFDYAQKMLDSAKDESYRLTSRPGPASDKAHGGPSPGGPTGAPATSPTYPATVDYLFLKDSSPLPVSPAESRERRHALPHELGRSFTGGPYLYKDFKREIAPAVGRLGEVPSAQLSLAVRLLRQHPTAARLELAHQVYVRADKAWRPLLGEDPRKGWPGLGEKWLDFFIAETGSGLLRSRFLDALKLWQAGRR